MHLQGRAAQPPCLVPEEERCLPAAGCWWRPQSCCRSRQPLDLPVWHRQVEGISGESALSFVSVLECLTIGYLPPQKLPLPVEPGSTPTGPLCWISGCSLQFPQITPAQRREEVYWGVLQQIWLVPEKKIHRHTNIIKEEFKVQVMFVNSEH